jgi:hypothetical protein
MKRLLAAAAVVALAACSDVTTPAAPRGAPGTVRRAEYYDPTARIFSTQTPASTLDATPGWEAGTRFTTTRKGLIGTMYFWKAVGETGTHTVRLWSSTGTLIWSASPSLETASGWQQTYSRVSVNIPPGSYVVSVNTNTAQVKTFNYFYDNGPIVRPYMTATGGAYGQPTGSFPSTNSASALFVDVDFTPICDTTIDPVCP